MSEELRTLVRQAVHEPGGGVPVDDIVRRAQARRTRRHALMGLAPALVLAAALVALPNVGVEQVDLAPISPTAREAPAPVTVTLDRTVVPQGTEIEITATLWNNTDHELVYGVEYELALWDGATWTSVGTRAARAYAGSPGSPAIGFPIAPGRSGTDQIVTGHLEPGRYRYTKELFVEGDDEVLHGTATFEVVADSGQADPETLVGRTFVSVEVTRDGEPFELVPGTRIRVAFPEGEGPAWWGNVDAGCNTSSGPPQIGPERLRIGGMETLMGCTDALHAQDRWVFAFFEGNPSWQLEGSVLRLWSQRTVIVLEEVDGAEPAPAPEPEPEPAPEPEPEPEAPAQDPAALWGRSFVSVSVTEAGQPRQLLPGTRLTVEFEHRDPAGVVRWHSGCNFQGAEVTITPERIHTRDITTTDIGCPPEQHEQDAWSADFFRGHPFWSLDGSRLMLVASRTVIAFEETD